MSAGLDELLDLANQFLVPVRGQAEDHGALVELLPDSALPTEAEMQWLVAARGYVEQQEFTPGQIEKMYAEAGLEDFYPVPPCQPLALVTRSFIKYGDGDWGYMSSNWQLPDTFPAPPGAREAYERNRQIYTGPFTLPELLNAIHGHVDVDAVPPCLVPNRYWVAFQRDYRTPAGEPLRDLP